MARRGYPTEFRRRVVYIAPLGVESTDNHAAYSDESGRPFRPKPVS